LTLMLTADVMKVLRRKAMNRGRIPPWMRGPRKRIVTCRLSTADTSLRHHLD
jgi:hypothetical protein